MASLWQVTRGAVLLHVDVCKSAERKRGSREARRGREREKEDRQSEGNRKREGGDQAGKETVERRQEASPRGLTQTAQTRRTNTTGAGAGGGGCVSACVR